MSTELETANKTEETETAEVENETSKFFLRPKKSILYAVIISMMIALGVFTLHSQVDGNNRRQAALEVSQYSTQMEIINKEFYALDATGETMLAQMRKMSDLKTNLYNKSNPYVVSTSNLAELVDLDLAKMQAKLNGYYAAKITLIESGYDLNSISEDYQSLIDSYSSGSEALAALVSSLLPYEGLLNFNSMDFSIVELNSEIGILRVAIYTAKNDLQGKIDAAIANYDATIKANTVDNGNLEEYRNAIAALATLRITITGNASFVGVSNTKSYSDTVDAMITDYSTKAEGLQTQADAAAATAAANAKASSLNRTSSSTKTSSPTKTSSSTPPSGRILIKQPDGSYVDFTDACAAGYFDCTSTWVPAG